MSVMTILLHTDDAFGVFCEEHLQRDGVLFKVFKTQKTKTFTTTNKMSMTKVKGKKKNIAIDVDCNLFQHLVVIAGVRKLDLRKLMMYNLGAFPLALATVDGSLTKTTKATLYMESSVEPELFKVFHWAVCGL